VFGSDPRFKTNTLLSKHVAISSTRFQCTLTFFCSLPDKVDGCLTWIVVLCRSAVHILILRLSCHSAFCGENFNGYFLFGLVKICRKSSRETLSRHIYHDLMVIGRHGLPAQSLRNQPCSQTVLPLLCWEWEFPYLHDFLHVWTRFSSYKGAYLLFSISCGKSGGLGVSCCKKSNIYHNHKNGCI
jgi:hypothetical protein